MKIYRRPTQGLPQLTLILLLLAAPAGMASQAEKPAAPGVTPQAAAGIAPLLGAIEADEDDLSAYRRLFVALRRELAKPAQREPSPALARAARFFEIRLAAAPEEPHALFGRGVTAKLAGDYQGAVTNLEASIRAGARFWEVFEELIPFYRTRGETLSAISMLEERRTRDPSNAFVHQGLGYLHFWLDDYSPSEKYLARALEIMEAAGDRTAQIGCLFNQAYLGMYLNQYENATRDIQRSLRFAREMEILPAEVRAMELLSFIKIEQGDTLGALELIDDAFRMARDLDDPELVTLCRRTLGVARMDSGDFTGALKDLERCAADYTRGGELRKLEVVHYWLSVLLKNMGEFTRSLRIAKTGLTEVQKMGFRTAEAFYLSTIGDLYHILGHNAKAISYNKKALVISQKYIGKWSREQCLNSIGAVYMETERYTEALEYFKLALNYIRQISHIREEARCLYNIGIAYFEMEQGDRALDYFLRSRREADLNGQKAVLGMALNRLGDLALQRNDEVKAESNFKAALALGAETGQPGIRWQACAGLGALAARRERVSEAAGLYLRAVEIIENQRSQILESEHSAGFFRSKLDVYESLVNLYYGLHVINPDAGYDRECFLYAEKAKGRAFLDDLRAARIDPRTFSGSPENRHAIRLLSDSVSSILTELSRSGGDRAQREALQERLERAEEELQIVVEAARRERPELSRSLRGEPCSLAEIRETALEPGTALIEYLVGESHLFIFYLTGDRLAIHRMGREKTRAMRELVRNYTRLLASPRITAEDCAPAGRQIYERLILPGKDVITRDIQRLIIIPDREICYLPFEALAPNARDAKPMPDYLVNTRSISYAPSASTLVNILTRDRPHDKRKDLLAVGDPSYPARPAAAGPRNWDNPLQEYALETRFDLDPLPYSRKEIRALSRFVRKGRRDIVLGKQASEETIKQLPLADYRILHFATHSLLDEQVANRSALILTQDTDPGEDGFLQVREIYLREMDAELVVLSSCRSALGKLERGEGVQGLPRAFFCAGADSVVVSLWPVDDRATARFMERFYRHLSSGQAKQEALRQAKLDMLKSKEARLRDWAGFILMGEGRRAVSLQRPPLLQRIISRIF